MSERSVRVLVVGEFRHEMYEPAFCDGLRQAGAQVTELNVTPFFGPGDLLRRAQGKYGVGPGPLTASMAVVAASARARPDIVLLWRTHWLAPLALLGARRVGARRIALFNNDDPFGPDRNAPFWRRFRRLVPLADICFAYRPVNVDEYREAGARHVALLRSYFDPRIHFPPSLTPAEEQRFGCDVVFVGHCEPDSRLAAMDRLLATDLSVRIFGSEWELHARGHRWEQLLPIRRVRLGEYRAALAAAKVALVFLSTRNRDQYTRRCFEIPAIGTMMLAPRTPELLTLFREGIEAAFFSTPDELVEQVTRYVANDRARSSVADAGRARVWADGHDVTSRARQFLIAVEALD